VLIVVPHLDERECGGEEKAVPWELGNVKVQVGWARRGGMHVKVQRGERAGKK